MTVRVLLYHEVVESARALAQTSNPRYTTALERLAKQVSLLRGAGYHLILFRDWLSAREGLREIPPKSCILTFDGPHIGWFRLLVPYLAKENIKAAFFVTGNWVGDGHPYPESRGRISWDDIIGLRTHRGRDGCPLFEIGSHSLNHTILERHHREDEAAFKQIIRREIVGSAKLLRAHLKCPTELFALAGGRGDIALLRPLFAEAGYRVVRKVSLPGYPNPVDADLLAVEIVYCDRSDHSLRDFSRAVLVDPPVDSADRVPDYVSPPHLASPSRLMGEKTVVALLRAYLSEKHKSVLDVVNVVSFRSLHSNRL